VQTGPARSFAKPPPDTAPPFAKADELTAQDRVVATSDRFFRRFVDIWILIAIALWAFEVSALSSIQYPSYIMLAAGLPARISIAAGRIKLARYLITVPVIGAVMVLPFFLNGVRTPVIGNMPLIIVLAGWILGRRAALFLTALLVLSVSADWLVEAEGWLVPSTPLRGPLVWWMVWAFTTAITGVVVWYLMGSAIAIQAQEIEINRKLSSMIRFNETILLNSPLPMGVYDAKGQCVRANEAYAQLVGATRDTLLAQNFHTIESWRRFGLNEDGMAALAQNRPQRREGPMTTSFGKQLWLECRILPIEIDGEGHILAQFVDLTERRQSEAELRQAKDKAEAANEAKSGFLAMMSHEIRTPMNGVMGMAQILMSSDLPAAERAYGAAILRSAESLLRVINDILDFSKIEAGKTELETIPFEPHRLVAETVDAFSRQAAAKGLALTSSVPTDIPPWFEGDPGRLRQILNNLVGNALKFTERGAVALALDWHGATGRPALSLIVRDTGIGMSPAALAGLFSPFHQADASITRRYGGTGLGLSISKRLAELMGGDIAVDTTEGVGTSFTVTIPIAVGAPAPAGVRPAQGTNPRQAGHAHVLVVEDNPINQLVATEMLSKLGLRTTVAGDGAEAIRLLEQGPFDLVFMDSQMPTMGGFEAAGRIRAGEAGPAAAAVPIIALTANAMIGERENCLANGMDDYIAKPIILEELVALVERWLPVRSAASDPGSATAPEIGAPAQVFDEKILMRNFAQDRRLARKVVAVSAMDMPRCLDALDRAVADRSWEAVKRGALSLKSATAQIGGIGLSERLARIERVLESGGSIGPDDVETLRKEYEVLSGALGLWYAGRASDRRQ